MSQFEENSRSRDFGETVPPERSQRRGCLWILVFVGVLVIIGCVALCLGVFAVVLSMGKEPYQMAVRLVTQDAQVVEKLGKPIEVASWFPQGSIHVRGDQGDANLTFQIRGPQGKATVNVVARRIKGKWGLTSLDVTYPDGTRQPIDVSAEGDSELDAPQWQPGAQVPTESTQPAGEEPSQSEDQGREEGPAPPSLEVKIPELPKL
ncbi:MAG: cytochrome c oxidase assembly factor Coa1 family protein [Thermogutta sp.]|nr:cytochrome c oxidase assembly factor Coa1 family protein [Thermogutta sp.]HOP76711.1 cytochrome c oxidase assembly factor Coa1 family protein [Thermogutta sp.]HPU07979.1 cytochrome c oxidase assembly factor Coa1 family protein [Thermogutta sp.]HPZ83489.1 cytochrome c oxidase assembly factor Coa1 family protein [Thermogutta sp.]HQF13717.1 cytochrome c oxidase assembly factor Coa1 family protein [Thermogutta sp.]